MQQVGGESAAPHYGDGNVGSSDANAALMGVVLITAKGKARADLSPQDVDREIVVAWTVTDENASPYLDKNIYDHVITPARGTVAPGWVSFASIDKARVLQKLYEHADHAADKLSYTEAKTEVDASIAENRPVDSIHGTHVQVWFTESSFDPARYHCDSIPRAMPPCISTDEVSSLQVASS